MMAKSLRSVLQGLLCVKALLSIGPLLLAAGWSRMLHNDGLVLFCFGLSLSITYPFLRAFNCRDALSP
jgi:hypothetical protein